MTMKTAKVSELKARLSAYLAQVRDGSSLVVCDRNTPIARLVPYAEAADDVVITEPRRPSGRRPRGVRLRRAVDVVGVLRSSRDQR